MGSGAQEEQEKGVSILVTFPTQAPLQPWELTTEDQSFLGAPSQASQHYSYQPQRGAEGWS